MSARRRCSRATSCAAARSRRAIRSKSWSRSWRRWPRTARRRSPRMGDDTPSAVLSKQYRPLSHYFRQNFSQVTNPPIDSLREYRVMSLKTRFGNLKNVLDESSAQTEIMVLESPFVGNAQWDGLMRQFSCRGRDRLQLRARTGRLAGRAGAYPRRGRGCRAQRCRASGAERSASGETRVGDADDPGHQRGAQPSDAQGAADLLLAQRALGRMYRPALFCRADRRGRDRGQRLSGRGHAGRPDRAGPAGWHPDRGGRAVSRGDRPGPAEDHVEDGDLGDLVLSRRPELRGRGPEPGDVRRVFPRPDQPHQRHRRERHSSASWRRFTPRLHGMQDRAADRRFLQGAQIGRDPRLGRADDAYDANRLQHGAASSCGSSIRQAMQATRRSTCAI